MAREVEAVVASLKADAQAQVKARPKGKRSAARIPEAEQIRRFLAGEEKARVASGEITPAQYRAYQEAMLERLRQAGALEV